MIHPQHRSWGFFDGENALLTDKASRLDYLLKTTCSRPQSR